MATPKVYRETDYSSVDFSNKAQGALEVLKDALTLKLGWTLEYEDTTSADKAFIVTNQGSGYYLKITHISGENNYLKFSAAQSYSSISDVVNAMPEYWVNCQLIDKDFLIVGTDKAFYLGMSEDATQTASSGTKNTFLIFVGDYIPASDGFIPSPFVVIPQMYSVNKESVSTPGLTFSPFVSGTKVSVLTSLEGIYEANTKLRSGWTPYDYDATLQNTACCVYAPGCSTIHTYGNRKDARALADYSPTMLVPAYLLRYATVGKYSSQIIGKLPGMRYLVNADLVLFASAGYTKNNVAGTEVVSIPSYYRCVGGIALTDWDLG